MSVHMYMSMYLSMGMEGQCTCHFKLNAQSTCKCHCAFNANVKIAVKKPKVTCSKIESSGGEVSVK